MLKNILIAVNDSKPAWAALTRGAELAAQLGGRVMLLHVVDVDLAFVPELAAGNPRLLRELRRTGEELLRKMRARIAQAVECAQLIVEGESADGIITSARQWPADLIVIGSDSRGRLAQFLLGSTADAVIRHAPCPVLTVRDQSRLPGARPASTVKGAGVVPLAR
jgi:nucleotide-binding universal stress UspA family protein